MVTSDGLVPFRSHSAAAASFSHSAALASRARAMQTPIVPSGWRPINHGVFRREQRGNAGRHYCVEACEPRTDWTQSPSGFFRVEEVVFLRRGWRIPYWEEDQFESWKRAFTACYAVSFGAWIWTSTFHLEACVNGE